MKLLAAEIVAFFHIFIGWIVDIIIAYLAKKDFPLAEKCLRFRALGRYDRIIEGMNSSYLDCIATFGTKILCKILR